MSDDKDIMKYNEIDMETGEASSTEEKEDEFEKVCFLCRRPESKTGPKIGRAHV